MRLAENSKLATFEQNTKQPPTEADVYKRQYLKERVQFDVPIGSFQALQHRMARLYTELEMLQSCVRAALSAIDTQDAELALLASLAKARASDPVSYTLLAG